MPIKVPTWICCQIGARENYAIPRALHQQQQLGHLLTDGWIKPNALINQLPPKVLTSFRERFHEDLSSASVYAYNNSVIKFELGQKLRKRHGWDLVVDRNQWFQQQALQTLQQLAPNLTHPVILFSYSYAALELFRFAQQQGWYTVLNQIDPGPKEDELVSQLYQKYPYYQANWQPTPSSYWETWRQECEIANVVIVNSSWSRQLVQQEGIDYHKIKILPLVYNPPQPSLEFVRTYPEIFSPQRPLRVLFLGQVILRKGMAAVLEAIDFLEGAPVEFWIVGSQQISIPTKLQNHSQIRWIGHVARSKTAKYYQLADVFLFPTLSDGFGLTQLEAQAWKLPVIASQHCGEVVSDGINGWILPEVNGQSISQIIQNLILQPHLLKHSAEKTLFISQQSRCFSIQQLSRDLENISCSLIQ